MSINVKQLGAIGDGLRHPLSERFSSLDAARAEYGDDVDLPDQLDWAAIRKAIRSSRQRLSFGWDLAGTVLLPPGEYLLNRQTDITGLRGLIFTGEGQSTVLHWVGPPDGTIYLLTDCEACRFQDFWLLALSGESFKWAFRTQRHTGQWTPQRTFSISRTYSTTE